MSDLDLDVLRRLAGRAAAENSMLQFTYYAALGSAIPALLERLEALEAENRRLREAARAVLPSEGWINLFLEMQSRDFEGIEPYFAEQWRRMLDLHAALAAATPAQEDA